jgi:Ca2+-binding RTX toxin-like protein
MAGGLGDDWYYVNTGKDSVTEAANAGLHDTIVADGIGWILGANFEDLVLLNGSAAKAIGNTLNNTITGSDVTDATSTTSGADFINGMAGNDTIDGKSGDDTLVGFTGNDSIDGGDGLDQVQFAGKIDDHIISAPDKDGKITVTDKNASANGNDGIDTLVNVERLVFFGDKNPVTFDVHAQGTDDDDVRSLTSAPDGFDGLGGNDSISGDGGNDSLEGDSGNDTLIGGAGDDQLGGGTGADEYDHAGTSVDGNDAVTTGDDGLDKVVFTGSNLFDLGFSRSGNDLIVGALKSGQTGFDGQVLVSGHYSGGAIGSVLIDTQFNGLYGTDLNQAKFVFTTNLGSGVNNTTFTEVLLGSDKADTIIGNGGFLDILAGNAGNDTIDGGTGTNLVDYGSAAAGIDVDLSQHKALVDGDGGQDTLITSRTSAARPSATRSPATPATTSSKAVRVTTSSTAATASIRSSTAMRSARLRST